VSTIFCPHVPARCPRALVEARLLHQTGETPAAAELLRDALAATPSTATPAHRALASQIHGALLLGMGEVPDAERELRTAAAEFRSLGQTWSEADAATDLADVLLLQGRFREAEPLLRRQAETFAALGDKRSHAVVMGKLADILQQRGETDEALRIRTEECLPVFERIQDIDGIANVRYRCAQDRLARGGLEQGEGQTIYNELAESFVLLTKLQRVDGIAVVGSLLGQFLAAAGHRDDALAVLEQSATAFERIGQLNQATDIRQLQDKIRSGGGKE
jgi:tetratricopeptide (TPR) repeat protein